MPLASRPAIVFFDAGLVLLHPDGRRLQLLVKRVTGLTLPASSFVAAYRHAIHQRCSGSATAAAAFPFWPAWCRWAGVPEQYASALAAEIQRAEIDAQKLWTDKDPDVEETLDALRAMGLRMGVISNADGELEADLSRAGLREYFECCLDSVQVGVHKPDRSIFQLALEQVGSSADEAWMVGDDYLNDIAPALEVGFAAAILYDPLDLWSAVSGHARIRRLTDVPRLAQRL